MTEPMIWSYLLHLSTHMWDDEHSASRGYYLPSQYTPENNVDLATWDETVRALGERKYNMVIIDHGDAVKYESHPEISAPDAWDKDFLKKKLDEMRALGIEPIAYATVGNGLLRTANIGHALQRRCNALAAAIETHFSIHIDFLSRLGIVDLLG